MKDLNLIPLLDACDFSDELEEEFASSEVSTHYQNDVVCIWNWDDTRKPEFKKWLVETYGEKIREYKYFGILST